MATETQIAEKTTWVVAALYQFRMLEDPVSLRLELYKLGERLGLCGTLIVANEGINGTVAGSASAIRELHQYLLAQGFDHLEYKESSAEEKPFKRFKVRQKEEIVTLGVQVKPLARVGHYVEPSEWNALISDPDVVLIDTRNRYETKVGTFKGAIDPNTDTFREFPEWIEANREQLEGKKVAMFCTGGIRCEKSTSLLLERGFEDVYHLKGGILKYLEDVDVSESLWDGECFVFDQRVTVGHGLEESDTSMCYSCGWPLEAAEREYPQYEKGVSCHLCYSRTSERQKDLFRQRQQRYEQQKQQAAQPVKECV